MHEPIEILTNEQVAKADALAARLGVPTLTLMENAGRAVADEAVQMVDAGASIAVLCGPGNNGGDGFVAARLLHERGYDVAVYLLGAVENLKGDAAEMSSRWLKLGSIAPIETALDRSRDPALVIDAIFGAGLTRPLEGDAHNVIERANKSPAGKLAVDVPSGLNGTTGEPLGQTVLQADRTVTFFRRKPAHLLYPGRALCGRVILADIGIPDAVLATPDVADADGANVVECETFENVIEQALFYFPNVRATSARHKFNNGHVVVLSGPQHRTGAARLGARAALRVGAGLVTIASPAEAIAANAAHLTAIMLEVSDGAEGLRKVLEDRRKSTVLIGPGYGVGSQTVEATEVAMRAGAAVVIDADALTSFAQDRGRLFDLAFGGGEIAEARQPTAWWQTVLTPHEGEFARLFPDVAGSKLERARTAAQMSNCVVVLKGPDTVVAAPDGYACINTNAPPYLATAGSGDVLAGLIAGLVARGIPSFPAACAAVWIHGACGNRFGPGLIAEDLPEIVPAVLGDIYSLIPNLTVHSEGRSASGQMRKPTPW